MNEVLRQLRERKSVRVFTDRPISPAEKAAILEGAVNAPTAGNQQLYTILDITDPAIRERLVETCDHQPFIAQAKLVLIFCADCRKWYDGFAAAGLYLWKRNTLVSIVAGTAVYMLLVQLVF